MTTTRLDRPRYCERCAAYDRSQVPTTTHQEYREDGDRPHWENRMTDRCDTCAQALRDFARLPSIHLTILIDEPIEETRKRDEETKP